MVRQMTVEGLDPGLECLRGDAGQLCAGMPNANINESDPSCLLHESIILHASSQGETQGLSGP